MSQISAIYIKQGFAKISLPKIVQMITRGKSSDLTLLLHFHYKQLIQKEKMGGSPLSAIISFTT